MTQFMRRSGARWCRCGVAGQIQFLAYFITFLHEAFIKQLQGAHPFDGVRCAFSPFRQQCHTFTPPLSLSFPQRTGGKCNFWHFVCLNFITLLHRRQNASPTSGTPAETKVFAKLLLLRLITSLTSELSSRKTETYVASVIIRLIRLIASYSPV